MSSSPPPEDQEARTQRHLACLDTLIAHGMDLANRVHHQATSSPAEPRSAPAEPRSAPAEPRSAPAEPGTAPTEPPTIPPITPETIALFDQISRAVRRAILVSRKLAEPLPLAAPKPDPGRIAANHLAARKRIIRDVEDTIHRAGGGNTDTLQAELHERVESVDLDDDIGNRPVHEIIAEICRDLGVTSVLEQGRFKRRTPQDLQTLQARAARPSRPAKPTAAPRPSPPRMEIPEDPGADPMMLRLRSRPESRPPITEPRPS